MNDHQMLGCPIYCVDMFQAIVPFTKFSSYNLQCFRMRKNVFSKRPGSVQFLASSNLESRYEQSKYTYELRLHLNMRF